MEAVHAEVVAGFSKRAKHIADNLQSTVTAYQPVEANIQRIAGKTRYQIVVQSESRGSLHSFLREWSAGLSALSERKVRWSIDVDPIEV